MSVAVALGIPVLATEQNRERMGVSLPSISENLTVPAFDKMSFSVTGCDEAMAAIDELGRRQIVIVGIETHICVSLTALDLVERGFEVIVCPDAVSSRTQDRHKLGMERLRDGGVVPAHTEAIAYEWMQTASHPRFRDVLGIVKNSTH